MIKLVPHKRDFDYTPYDYVFEAVDKFEAILPYLLPKLEGSWSIVLVEPKLTKIRTYLDTTVVPEYINLVITVEAANLERLYLERPQLVEKEPTNWDRYIELIKRFPVPMDDKAMREIYYRVGPKEPDLRDALNSLLDYPYISMKVVNAHFAPVNRVYASQVVQDFLLGYTKRAWQRLSMLEREIGSRAAFYAMRKQVRNLFTEKQKYLSNEDTSSRIVEQVDGYSVILLYWLFEDATSPNQLYPILLQFERRQTPCSS